jgi:RHS repeat-associated protein
LISQRIVGSGVSFYGYDGHGSVRLLIDAAGTVTDTYDYDAFGNPINRTGTTSNDYLYTGEQFDANLGFYYLRARYMNPSSGRFFTMDSFEGSGNDPNSLHKYLYTSNDPVNGIDPSGNVTLSEVVYVAGILGTIASFLFQTDRVVAPGNDPIQNEYYRTKADYEDAQINLALLIFTLFNATASAKVVAKSGGGKRIIGGGTGGRPAPYNPSGQIGENCAACVAAVIKSRVKKGFYTANDIEADFPLPNLPTARATADYIADATGTSLIPSSLNKGTGHYIIVREPTIERPLGHVVYARVSRYGRRYILDPQTNRSYEIRVGEDLPKDVRSLIGGNPKIFKVQE